MQKKHLHQKGYTLIEVLLVISISAILFGLTTINLLNVQHTTNVVAAEESVIADIKGQQIKAMNGNNTGGSYGIHFTSNVYTLFQGTSWGTATDKSPVTLDSAISLSGNDIVFDSVTGEVHGYVDATPPTVTVGLTAGSEQKILKINRYGAVTQQ